MSKLTPALEKRLYEDRRDLWAVSRVLIHAEQYKLAMWKALTPTDREMLEDLVEKSREHMELMDSLNQERLI